MQPLARWHSFRCKPKPKLCKAPEPGPPFQIQARLALQWGIIEPNVDTRHLMSAILVKAISANCQTVAANTTQQQPKQRLVDNSLTASLMPSLEADLQFLMFRLKKNSTLLPQKKYNTPKRCPLKGWTGGGAYHMRRQPSRSANRL